MTKYLYLIIENLKDDITRALGVYADEHEANNAIKLYLKDNNKRRLRVIQQKVEEEDVLMTFYNL